jgi:hypothetical protein
MLPLLMSVLFAWRPAVAQNVPSPDERRADILRLVLQYGERHWKEPEPTPEGPADPLITRDSPSPASAYLLPNSAGEPSYAEGSLEYAAALLMSGGPTDRAALIIGTVLSAQAAGGKCPGGFPWRPKTEPDAYATAYMAPWLAYIHQHLAASLPETTRTNLAASLAPALGAVERFDVRPEETQQFLSKAAAESMLAAALDNTAARARAATDFAAWLKQAGQSGFPNAQCPTSTAISAAALHWVWLAAPSDEARQGAASALEYLYRDLALRYQPEAARVAGAVVSGSYGDYATGSGAARYLLFAQFGRPELTVAEPFALFLAVPGFMANDETVELSRRLDVPRTIRVRAGDHTLTTYVHPRYALGTMSGPVDVGAAPVALTYGPADAPGAYCTVTPAAARVSAVQNGNQALVNFDFDNVGMDSDRLLVYAELHLGLKSSLGSVFLNQARYTEDYAVAVETRSSVATERDGVYTAVTPIVMGPATEEAWDDPVGPAQLSWVPLGGDSKDSELVLKMTARSLRAREKPRNNYRIGFAVEMGTREECPSIEEFAKTIYDDRRVKQETKAKTVKVGEKGEKPHGPELYNRPVERGNWIMETRVVQDMTYTSDKVVLELTEDLEQNRTVEQTVNGVECLWDFLYRSPALNQMPGDALNTVLRPPPSPPPAAEEIPPAAP